MTVLTLSRLQISHGNILVRSTGRNLVVSITVLLFVKYNLCLKLCLIVVDRLNRENLALAFTLVICLLLLLRTLCFLRLSLVQLDVCRRNDLALLDCVGLVVISALLKNVPSLFIRIFPRLFHLFEFVLIYGFNLVCYIWRFANKSLLLLSKIKLRQARIMRYQSCGNAGEALSLTLLNVLSRFFVVYFGRDMFLVRVDDRVTHNFIFVHVLNDFGLARCYLFKNMLLLLLWYHKWLCIQSLTRGPLSFFVVDGHEFMQLVEPRSTILALGLTALPVLGISFPFFYQVCRGI